MVSYRHLLLIAVLFLTLGCTKKSVVFVGEAEPAHFSLSFKEPEVFDFDIATEGKHDWEVELTYFPEQFPDWNEIPIYYIHTAPSGKESEGKFKIPVKDERGEWIGDVMANGHDRKTKAEMASGLLLSPGKHKVKIYGDNGKQGEPIYGIVRLTFKVIH